MLHKVVFGWTREKTMMLEEVGVRVELVLSPEERSLHFRSPNPKSSLPSSLPSLGALLFIAGFPYDFIPNE
jgi:hypothetical protein